VTRSALTKVQSLSLKAQEGYRCSHSNRSASEAQKPCKVCAGWLKAQNLSTKGRVEGLLLQEVHRVERIKYLEVFESLPQGVHAGVLLET
jgi:hypothetical protein